MHVWRPDDYKDYSIYHSYHPSYLIDLLENYEMYLKWNDPLDDLSIESQTETEYLKRVEKLHMAKTEIASWQLLANLKEESAINITDIAKN